MLKRYPILQIIIAVASLASIGVFIHKSEIPPIATGFYRCLLSIPILILVNSRKSTTYTTNKNLEILNLIGGIALGLDMCVWNLSFNYTTMAETNLIVNLTPLLIFPITVFYFKERFRAIILIPLLITILGLYLLVFSKNGTTNIHIVGDVMSLIAAVFYAIFVVVTKIAADNGTEMGHYMIKTSIYCSIVLLTAGLINNDHWLPHSYLGWLDLILLAIISQVFGQLFLATAMKKVPLQVSSTLLLLQPVFAAFYGVIIFKEYLISWQIIGAAIILFGVYLFRRI